MLFCIFSWKFIPSHALTAFVRMWNLSVSLLWWCNDYDVGLTTKRVAVRLLAVLLSDNNLRQVVHTRACVTKQYKLVLVKEWWCPMARKVTVGLASHWPCVTDFSVLSIYGLSGLRKGDEYPACNSPLRSMSPLYLFTVSRCEWMLVKFWEWIWYRNSQLDFCVVSKISCTARHNPLDFCSCDQKRTS